MANLGVAIAAGAININRIRRGPNCVREAAVSSENIYDSLRLHPHQITTLAWEYTQWRRQKDGVAARYHNSVNRMTTFLHYLARGGYYHQLGRTEGLSASATFVHVHSVAAFFQDTAAGYAMPLDSNPHRVSCSYPTDHVMSCH
jgi:hypothetical protein